MSVVVAAEEKPKAVPMGKTLDDLFSVLAVPAGEQKEICTYLADPAIRQFARTMIIRPEQAARMIGYLPREHQRPLNESAAERRRGDIDRNEFARGTTLIFGVLAKGEKTLTRANLLDMKCNITDGQTRLRGLADASSPLPIGVTFVLYENTTVAEREAMRLDGHTPRGDADFAHILKLKGKLGLRKSDGKPIISATRNIVRSGIDPKGPFERTAAASRDRFYDAIKHYGPAGAQVMHSIFFGKRDPGKWPAEIKASEAIRRQCMQVPYMSVLMIAMMTHPQKAERFIAEVMMDNRLSSASPVKAFLDYLKAGSIFPNWHHNKPGAMGQVRNMVVLNMVWDAYVNGRQLRIDDLDRRCLQFFFVGDNDKLTVKNLADSYTFTF